MAVKLSTAAPMRGNKRWAYLERQSSTTIRVASAANGDDPIYVSPLWFVVKDRVIYLPMDQANRHVKNIEAGGRLSAVVDEGDSFGSACGVSIEGSAKRVDDEALSAELNEMILEKHFYTGHPYLEEYINFGEYYGRTWYEIVPEKMIGWDLREITNAATLEKRVMPAHALNGGS